MDAEDSKEKRKKVISRPRSVAYLAFLCVLGVLCVPFLTKVSPTMDLPEAGRQLRGGCSARSADDRGPTAEGAPAFLAFRVHSLYSEKGLRRPSGLPPLVFSNVRAGFLKVS
jgi:hypothetical protein